MYNRCLTTVLSALLAFSAWEMPTLCGGGDALARTQDPQGRLVKGTVTSNDGEPLAGAFVYVKNSKLGVNTDLDGHYEIAAPVEGKSYVLVFQFLGMTTKEFTVSGPKTLNVSLMDDSSLEEAVIVGAYGVKQKKEDMIGSAFQVNADALKDKPKARIDNILNGLVPGLLVDNNTDAAGSTRGRLNVRVRGNASLSASNEPLWIIDGVPTYTGGRNNLMPGMSTSVSPLSLIDPNDIESITVLKDADQTTIYGANGANGVILVTTKRGVAGNMPLKVSATVNYGVAAPDKSTMVKVMNASQYLEVAKEAWVNGGNKMSDFPYQDNDYNSYSTTSTDWFNEYIGLGSTLYASLSLSTGTKKAKTYVSGSYYRNENTVKADESQRFYLRMNQDYDLTERLKMGVSLMATYNNDDLFPLSYEYLENLPIFSPYLEDGKTCRLYNKIWSDTGKDFIMKKFLGNKLPNREYNDNIQNSLKTIGNFKLDWTIIDGLKLSSVFGVEYQPITEVCTIPVRHWPGCWTASLSESPAGRTPPISTGQTPTNWTSPRSSEGTP
jgi:TonB-linked SusC/RagA family outer membrane protein